MHLGYLASTDLLRRLPITIIIGKVKPSSLNVQVTGTRFCRLFPEAISDVPMSVQPLKRTEQHFQGFYVGGSWFGVAQFECLGCTALTMGFVRMTEENLRFPCLGYILS